MAWLRVLYTILGAVVAFGVGALIWPVRARVSLRYKLASILEGSGTLYRAVTAAALHGIDNEQQVRHLDRHLHDLRRGITQQMDEARSELSFSRFNEGQYQAFVEVADQIRRRLTAMAEDTSLYVHAHLQPGLVPSLPLLVEKTAYSFFSLASAVRSPDVTPDTSELETAIGQLDANLDRLRELRMTTPFALDRMLPFWALVFNLREVAQYLKHLQCVLPQVA
jgi:uncharacterized membrane protein YccC